ncbi:MAG: DNA topoisomerase IV subunit A [Planctomycetaceae bacterium]|jgi:DNA topoisomerase-6 subunit A|nr:DNA topoisomerase IV subunit A [Planctomycetaceae bacterium]
MAKKKVVIRKKATKKSSAKSDVVTSSTKREPVKYSPKDKITLGKLVNMANDVAKYAEKRKDPALDIPLRSLSNVSFNPSKKILEMGRKKTQRQLFNLSQAKSFMQTMLVGSGTKQLINEGKTTSIRGLYYMLKHKIAGTNESTFHEQGECDTIIEDMEVLIEALREEMHLAAENKGNMVGEIILNDSGDEIDCSHMGSGGYGIPSIVEPNVIQFKKCRARFILHVEKGTVWQRFNEDKFWKKYHCILTHGGGQPPRGVRRLLHRLHNELKLPVYCLLDNDPWGYYIYSVIKQGSINLAFESQRMAIPEAKYLGVRSIDFERCKLSNSVIIALSDNDRKRALQIANYPWFEKKKAWQKEIQQMIDNGFKLEVEALISRDVSYVTEQYVPERLAEGSFLD